VIALALPAPAPGFLVAGVVVILACACGVCAAILDVDLGHLTALRRRRFALLEREKDTAAGLGWPWQRWMCLRIVFIALGIAVAFVTGINLLYVVGPIAGAVGFRFALAGRAADRRLRMERAFIGQLRNLRDRMALSNQSLDTALQELGRNPGPELEYVLSPLSRGGSTVANVVEMGMRARSPIVDQAAGVLIWSRSRSLESLIDTIDTILIPVGEAQLAVQEEGMVSLAQQRAVTFAMSALLAVMLAVLLRISSFRQYYQSPAGQLVLVIVALLFAMLVGLLGAIARTREWTRWDLRSMAEQQERLGD
jgi:Flp pilus assembly protein TadB